MRNTVIIGSVLALVGLASIAHASDRSRVSDRNTSREHREMSDDKRGDRHDRYERKDRSRERHDESSERRRGSHDEPSHEQDRR